LERFQTIEPLPERLLGMLMAFQGWFRCRLSDFYQAELLLKRSLELVNGSDFNQMRSFAHFALGFLLIWMGRFEESMLHLTTSRAIAEKLSDKWVKAWATEMQMEMAFESGQARSLKEPFLDTLGQFEEIGEQRGISRALNYLGNIALDRGEHAQAGEYYQRMLVTVEKVGDAWGSAAGYSKLGQLAWEAGEYERALTLLRRSLHMLQKMGDQRRSAYAMRQLGEIACSLGRAAEAQGHFQQALETASRLRSLPLVQDILSGIAALWLQVGAVAQAGGLLDLLLSVPVADKMTSSRAERLSRQVKAQHLAGAVAPLEALDQTLNGSDGEEALWRLVDRFLRDGIPLLECKTS
jgi:tetratricopeptide (TPR) repeat protein